ncbi:MAG: hypothetical protein ACUVRL_07735 [Candidatus Saccharicenans sp.]|uniref:hypothetical protein n=1 Tax=Candidatus Saccharicenans sp. TaxID=2819258 RepID=UPI00404B2208
MVFSVRPDELKQALAGKLIREAASLEAFFRELRKAMKLIYDLYLWHPHYLPEKLSPLQEKVIQTEYAESRKTRISSW